VGSGAAAHPRAPAIAALAVFALAGLAVLGLAGRAPEAAPAAAPVAAATGGNWQVESGSLTFVVRQMGADVQGSLPDWRAEIRFDDSVTAGPQGHVRVEIDTTTLALGSVTDQAKGAEFFDTATHKTALFEADILPDDALIVSIEAGTTFGWERYTGRHGLRFGIDSFGASAPIEDLFKHFGLTADAITPQILARLGA